jgi:predicted  nucleic acid-binding Zn-ribbon protein
MPFNQDSKLAVLESKLNIYEELSREMLSKLESAVEKISEGNNRIATILAKHDERIEQSIKTDELLVRMIDEIKEENEKEHEEIGKKFEKIEQKIEDLFKFRWQVGGVAAIAVIAVSVFNAFVPKFIGLTPLTSSQYSSSIERAK